MKVRCNAVTLYCVAHTSYGRQEQIANEVCIERATVPDFDGQYEYSIATTKIAVELEKIGGEGHFTQLQCVLSVPRLRKEKLSQFGVTMTNGNLKLEEMWLGLPLGKAHVADLNNVELLIEIKNGQEVLFSCTLPLRLELTAAI